MNIALAVEHGEGDGLAVDAAGGIHVGRAQLEATLQRASTRALGPLSGANRAHRQGLAGRPSASSGPRSSPLRPGARAATAASALSRKTRCGMDIREGARSGETLSSAMPPEASAGADPVCFVWI